MTYPIEIMMGCSICPFSGRDRMKAFSYSGEGEGKRFPLSVFMLLIYETKGFSYTLSGPAQEGH
jgi:hypothetical protein